MSAFKEFTRVAHSVAPEAAIVLGSGLGDVAAGFMEAATISFVEVPGLATTTVRGHVGRIAVGHWHRTPTLLFLGRLHFYEGHSREAVVGPVRLAAELGVKRLILTNAAGGIHPSLVPGSLMAIRGHIKVIGHESWRAMAEGSAVSKPYSSRLLEQMPGIQAGVYAALTGPSYETPAEIRALAANEVDAVGMSTALEAEAAAALGLEVVAISCITNRAAGLSATPLDHAEVLVNANLATERLTTLIGSLLSEAKAA
jgi:purine-nucleoside phosphorylase